MVSVPFELSVLFLSPCLCDFLLFPLQPLLQIVAEVLFISLRVFRGVLATVCPIRLWPEGALVRLFLQDLLAQLLLAHFYVFLVGEVVDRPTRCDHLRYVVNFGLEVVLAVCFLLGDLLGNLLALGVLDV
jgi:hypothetical protein